MQYLQKLWLVLDKDNLPIVKCDTQDEAIRAGHDQIKWGRGPISVVPARLTWEGPDLKEGNNG